MRKYNEPMEILVQGRRVNAFLIEEIRNIFFESLYKCDLKEQSNYISRRLRDKFGMNWFVFMWDEIQRKSKVHYFNNNELVLQFKWVDWNVLIYGID